MAKFSPQSVLIVGLGLIGGSVAKGLKESRSSLRVLAVDEDEAALQAALKDGAVDETGTLAELPRLLQPEQLIVIALPPGASVEFLGPLSRLLDAHAPIVTDVSSVKQPMAAAARALGKGFRRRFVPGHPIAGSERSGYDAARGDLFRGRNVILCPLADNEPGAVAAVHRFWRGLGAEVLGMAADHHDQVLAATSHLPHLLSYAAVDTLLDLSDSGDKGDGSGDTGDDNKGGDNEGDDDDKDGDWLRRYAAGGFADFSRLAASDPLMWADIFSANAGPVAAALDAYMADLSRFKQALQEKDRAYMMAKFRRARQARAWFLPEPVAAPAYRTESEPELIYTVQPGGGQDGTLNADVFVPGDKSISHRAAILGAIAAGVTRLDGFLEGEDTRRTLAALQELGVTISGPLQGRVEIYGVGLDGLLPPRRPLDLGNSGTAMRLLAGLLAAQPFAAQLTGDESLCRRPMARIAEPLALMGADVATAAGGTPPLLINRGSGGEKDRGEAKGRRLQGIDYRLPVASAQLKSCLLLAGLYADGETCITEPAPCRDHTERMLMGFGHPIERDLKKRQCRVKGGRLPLRAARIRVPADISSAAFFMVAAAITPGAELRLRGVGVNPTRRGVIDILRLMGGDVSLSNEAEAGGEPVADIRVRHSRLRGIEIPPAQVPLAIDEFPALFIAAAYAEGETRLRGAEELRVKESDRIEAMAAGLRALGVEVETAADGIRIRGGLSDSRSTEVIEVDSRGDHRIAMAFAVAALGASVPIRIRRCNNVDTSFPGFHDTAAAAGLRIRREYVSENP